MRPKSCDTFVVLPPLTLNNTIVFGKNSDRPKGEVQEIVYISAEEHPPSSRLQCTYIEIEQALKTNAVILSKPAWMWGAEMGANEKGLCIGNEAVWTKLNGPSDSEEALLGMDLVRLGLERAHTAEKAVKVIAGLLTQYGQGGPCSDIYQEMTYHNSFLLADRKEAWVMETAGRLWAAHRISEGFCNISNCLSIGTEIDLCSDNLREEALKEGLWDGTEPFHFTKVFGLSDDDDSRYHHGRRLLSELTASGRFDASSMMQVLRHRESGICRGSDHRHPTVASQVSVLTLPESKRPCSHWFTGTPDPGKSVFKPFVFCSGVHGSPHTVSPIIPDDPAKVKPRFQHSVDRRHTLYKQHESTRKHNTVLALESSCVSDLEAFLDSCSSGTTQVEEARDLFKDVVESEIKLYK